MAETPREGSLARSELRSREVTPLVPTSAVSIVTTKKEKDPRRVEAGKRLAAISKQAKERKRVEREERLRREEATLGALGASSATLMVVLTAAGVVVALATLWYTRREYYASQEDAEGTKETSHSASEGRRDWESL